MQTDIRDLRYGIPLPSAAPLQTCRSLDERGARGWTNGTGAREGTGKKVIAENASLTYRLTDHPVVRGAMQMLDSPSGSVSSHFLIENVIHPSL